MYVLTSLYTAVQMRISRVGTVVEFGDDQYQDLNQCHDNHKTLFQLILYENFCLLNVNLIF